MILVVPLGYELLIRRQKVVITPAFPWIVAYFLVQIRAPCSPATCPRPPASC